MELQMKRERKKTKDKKSNNDSPRMLDDEEQLRLQNQLRKAAKMSKQLEALYQDSDEEGFSLLKYPVRECKLSIPGMQGEIAINPVVTLIAVVCLWAIVIWCKVNSDVALTRLSSLQTYVSLTFTWLFHGTKVVYFFFVMFVAYKYGHIRLGETSDKPEFSNLTYFSMIITAGACNSLVVCSVQEPMIHQQHHFFAQSGYRSQDELDMFAINITLVDWGVGSWAVLTVVAIALSLATYRLRLPLIFRSCFYPILGHYTWGWIGDFIDGFTIVVSMFPVIASLGTAGMHLVAGFLYLGWVDELHTDDYLTSIQNVVVWTVTIFSLISVISGIHGGVKIVCLLAISLATLSTFLVFILDDMKFLLNLQVQGTGLYLQTGIFQLNFWTDAFGQLREGSGRAIDGNSSVQTWMQSWFNFSLSWWVTQSAVMGQFIASISRGRKIWEVLLFSIVLPVVYCIVYFCVWGGIGLRQSRQALELKVFGETYFNNSNHFLVDGSELCQDVPQENLVIGEDLIFTNLLPGVTPVCVLDEEDVNSAAFHVFDSFAVGEIGLGPLLALLYMLTIVLFHMTTAASSSLVMDKLASNGRKNNHLARRMFWLLTAGAVTTVLLQTGGNALVVIQGALIVCCLPVSVLLCYVLQSIMLMCRATDGTDEIIDYVFPNQPEFDFPIYGGIFNVMEYIASLGKVNPSRIERGMNNATRVQCIEFFKGLFVPFVSLHQVLYLTYPENVLTNTALALFYTSCYLGWFGFIIVSLLPVGTSQRSMTWVLLVVNGCLLGHVRSGFRARYNLRSNTVGDVISSLILWPQVLSQMRLECVKQSKFNKVDSDNLTADEMTSNS